MAKRIRTINTESLQKTAKTGGCGEPSLQTKIIKREPMALFFVMTTLHNVYGIYL